MRLSAEERPQLDGLIRKGKRSAQLLTKARILLKADVSEVGEGWSDSRRAAALDTSIATIGRTRRQLVEEGFEAALTRKYNPNSAGEDFEAQRSKIDRVTSSGPRGFRPLEPAPARGEGRRTAHCRARQRQPIGRTLKNTFSNRIASRMGDPAGRQRGLFANMEDVLEVYQRPHDPQRPSCARRNLEAADHQDARADPREAGRKARHDYEYERNGVANLFMVFAPLEGWRHVKVTDRHTAIEYAQPLRDSSDVHFPDAAKIVCCRTTSTPTSPPRSRSLPRRRGAPAGRASGE